MFQQDNSLEYNLERTQKIYVVGLAVKTSNATFQKDVPPLWERFNREKLSEKIQNRHQHILAVYTDYEGDYTNPFTYVYGCEVDNLDNIPEGMIGKEVPAAFYAVLTPIGQFPQSLIETWQKIWESDLNRSYTTDFEKYSHTSQMSPDVKLYIAIDE